MKKMMVILLVGLILAGCAAPVASRSGGRVAAAAGIGAGVRPVTKATALAGALVVSHNLTGPGRLLHSGAAGNIVPQTGRVPSFDHIVVILFENRRYDQVIGVRGLPNFTRLSQQNVLFTNFYAVAHPSLPNYLALIGGSTFGYTKNCYGSSCSIDAPTLPDRLEAGGFTWKTYQEHMTGACDLINDKTYNLTHDPFIYFNSIRDNPTRCKQDVVPMTQLAKDLKAKQLPNFAFIMPDMCSSAHNCGMDVADRWLGQMVTELQNSHALGQNYAIFILFDEAKFGSPVPANRPDAAGGHIPAILISPEAKIAFKDATPLNHYSLLKTILTAWNLPGLGETDNSATTAITAPWK